MTITEFLEARIAEDEAEARAATPGPWDSMTEETGNGENIYYTVEHGDTQLLDMADSSGQGRADAYHIARHNPARVLAECEAKRAIAGLHKVGADQCDEHNAMFESIPCPTIRALAAVYKDHRDYQQEWA
jgi:hypothetical protein